MKTGQKAQGKNKKQKKKTLGPSAKIRSIERFLQRPGLSDEVVEAKRAELKQIQRQKFKNEQAALERDMSHKYHMVKFFEKKKVTRRLKKVQARLAAGEYADAGARAADEKLAASLQADLHYILYYPRDQPYLALFPTGEIQPQTQAKQQAIRAKIAQKIADGKIDPSAPHRPLTSKAAAAQQAAGKKSGPSKGASAITAASPSYSLADDPFFVVEDDEEDGEGQSEGEGEAEEKEQQPRQRAPTISAPAAAAVKPPASSKKAKDAQEQPQQPQQPATQRNGAAARAGNKAEEPERKKEKASDSKRSGAARSPAQDDEHDSSSSGARQRSGSFGSSDEKIVSRKKRPPQQGEAHPPKKKAKGHLTSDSVP